MCPAWSLYTDGLSAITGPLQPIQGALPRGFISSCIVEIIFLRLGFSGLSRAMVTKNWWIDGCKEGKLSLYDKSCSSVQLRFFWLAFHSFHFHNLSQQTRPPHTLIGFHTVPCFAMYQPHISWTILENHSLSLFSFLGCLEHFIFFEKMRNFSDKIPCICLGIWTPTHPPPPLFWDKVLKNVFFLK